MRSFVISGSDSSTVDVLMIRWQIVRMTMESYIQGSMGWHSPAPSTPRPHQQRLHSEARRSTTTSVWPCEAIRHTRSVYTAECCCCMVCDECCSSVGAQSVSYSSACLLSSFLVRTLMLLSVCLSVGLYVLSVPSYYPPPHRTAPASQRREWAG